MLHAGRQDVALLRRVWGTEVRNVFDTQVAAGFAGMRAQIGYEALLNELLDLRVRKSASFTRWDARPLSDEQVEYAREDVLHLLQAADALKDRLDRLGRLDWAQEECRVLEEASDTRDIETVFGRLPRVNSLDPGQRAVARALAQWREDVAASEDRPVQTVLQDAALVEIAKRRPKDIDRLRQIRGLHEGVVRRRGKAILDEVGARPRAAADRRRGQQAAADPPRRRGPDRARRGARPGARRARRGRLRAARRARGPAEDRHRRAARARRARRAHAQGLAARGRRRGAARAAPRPPRACQSATGLRIVVDER